MNSRVRALVWEELRVGGPIAAVCLAVGLLLIVRVNVDGFFASGWLRAGPSVLAIALGMPLLCSLLLVLNVRNSGHLGGGFSRRILRLPVDTGTAVTVTFGIRFAEMLTLTLLLKLACWLLYSHGPGWDAVLLVIAVYALVQMLDWMRAVFSWQLTALFGTAFALLIQFTGLLEWWGYLTGSSTALPPPVMVIVGWVALAFAVSLGLVVWTRRGERVALWQRRMPTDADRRAGPVVEAAPFASARAAQLWYQLRQHRLLLPSLTVLFWMGGVVLNWLIDFYLDTRPGTNSFSAWLVSTKTYFFLSQLMPFVALVCASAGWRLIVGLDEGWRGRQALRWSTRLPLPRAEAARTRMLVAGFHLAVMLAVVTAVYLVAYLVPERFLAARLFGTALAHGEASLREVLMALLGPVLVFGLLASIAMNLSARLLLVYAAVVVGGALVWLGADTFDFVIGDKYVLRRVVDPALEPFAVWFFGVAPSVLLVVNLAALGWMGWIRRSSIVVCAGLWLCVALALYPFTLSLPPFASTLAALYCAGFAALAVSCWPERVMASAGGLRAVLHREKPEQHGRAAAQGAVPLRAVAMLAVLAVLGGTAWLRWPAPPKALEAQRAQGLPATLEEENQWYAPVPEALNLASRYLETVKEHNRLLSEWNASAKANPALQEKVKESKARDALDNVLCQGNGKVGRTEPISAAVWLTTLDYAAAVAGPVTEQLHAAAQSGLTRSRYPIDLRKGPAVELPHLAELRSLARDLGVTTTVAAVKGHPDDAAAAILDEIPLANSLAGEPILISQLVRIAVYGIAVAGLQTAMNRTAMPDSTLARLQDGLKQALPPLEKGPVLSRAMAGEEVFSLNYAQYYGDWASVYETYWSEKGAHTRERSAGEVLRGTLACMGNDLVGMDRTERMVMRRLYRSLRDEALDAAKAGRLPNADYSLEKTSHAMSFHAPMAYILMPALGRSYEAEWRCRTMLGMAQTALAVERYRLANGRLPVRLVELVPAFLDRVPTDPWNNGKPLSYRVKENGEFVVYSFGRNETDQKGEEVKDNWWMNGDITFTVAPPEVRERPQVAEAPAAGV